MISMADTAECLYQQNSVHKPKWLKENNGIGSDRPYQVDVRQPLIRGDPIKVSPRSLASENLSPWAIVQHYLHDPMFERFETQALR